PEGFLLAASRLVVAPESCLVFEDTEMGIQAARAAGMASVKVPPPWERRISNVVQFTLTGPLTVETRTNAGPEPNSTRLLFSSHVLRPSLQTLAAQLKGPWPSDSSTTPD